jgi:four helix bundle protein
MRREPGTGNREPESTEPAHGEWSLQDEGCLFVMGFGEDGSRSVRDHRDLDVWKLSLSFATEIYQATSKFPSDEKFGLTSQLRRAAVSIPTNISEGYGRETSGSYIQFLRIAQGSAKEIQTLLELSHRLGMLKAAERDALDSFNERLLQMLFRLIRAIERTRR